jgi:protein SCO1
MADIQKEFINDDEIQLLSHSVTPEKDSVPVLKEYAAEKKINFKRWKLLTGDKDEIYDLGRKYYFVEEDEGVKKGSDIFLHTENFILIDKQRHIRGIYNGLDPDSMQNLIRDIKVLKLE